MIALDYAHGHQIPFLAVNTCVHELLHVLLLAAIRKSAEAYVQRLRSPQVTLDVSSRA